MSSVSLMRVSALCMAFMWIAATAASAQQIPFSSTAYGDSDRLAAAMPDLVRRVRSAYREPDQATYLDNLFRFQMVAHQYRDALGTLEKLRGLNSGNPSPQARAANVQYEIFARAKAAEIQNGTSFESAFRKAFRETFATLDDRTSALVARALYANLYPVGISLNMPMEQDLRRAIERQNGRTEIALLDAIELIRAYQVKESYSLMTPLVEHIVGEDDRRRYRIADVKVRTPDGATICALVARPRSATGPLPALLEFTIYADPAVLLSEARRSASNGYIGVEGLTRGKRCSPDRPVPYEHDGADAVALIEWISKQPWNDGRVGMFGASYNGFAQWAAAKHMPHALKAMMPSVTNAPGIDSPMEGNAFFDSQYPWSFYTTANKTLDPENYGDTARWAGLRRKWYVSGQSFRSLDKIDGRPNPIFNRWLDHPSYDAFWQRMVAYGTDFSRINIPVLTTTGYYDGGMRGALYFLSEHYKYSPKAEHYLVVGPYSHSTGNRGTINALGDHARTLGGYHLDPVAMIDIGELRYQWFDHVFKGAPKPALLQDKINYQLTGANVWRHAPSLAAMAGRTMRFYLSPATSGDIHRLSRGEPVVATLLTQRIDLADRSDVDRNLPGGGVLDTAIDTWNGAEFVSDPLPEAAELSGLFSGRLEFVTNKKDFDFNLQLYELTPRGEYVQLAYYLSRASHVRDRSRRMLLTPGKPQRLDFTSGRLMGRQAQRGSRLIIALSVVKQPGAQINYGTGKDVSDETVADAGVPLSIKWLSGSFIDIPVRP